LITRIQRELKKLNSQTISDPMKKWENGLNRAFSKEEVQMTKKHMKKMLTIPGHKGNANQNDVKIPPPSCYVKNMNSKCWRGCWEKGTFIHCWWECKLVQPLWKTVWRVLKKTKNRSAV
jgi:hypothetical protein